MHWMKVLANLRITKKQTVTGAVRYDEKAIELVAAPVANVTNALVGSFQA